MEAHQNVLKTGTSTIGITFDGGVVVGADHRATMGHFIANKSVQKLFKIGENLALTTAGLVGHAQSLSRTLSAEVALFQLRRQQQMTVRGAATLTANILSGRPHWVQLLIVGVDDDQICLMQTALAHASRRVVLKRPAKAAPMADIPPASHQIIGKSVRYDVFMRS